MTVKTITIGIGATGLAALLCMGGDARAHEDVDAKFQTMDKNGDGKISAEEHEEAADELFEKLDTNHDDKVTVVEMDEAHTKMMGKAGGKPRMSAAEKIKVIDTNKDGVISEDEFEESSKVMFENIDTDKDGYVTKAELKAGHDKAKAKGQSK